MVPAILSQQVKKNMDLLEKYKSLVNRNASPQRKNKASKPNIGSNLLASNNIKTLSMMDCVIQPSTNLSRKVHLETYHSKGSKFKLYFPLYCIYRIVIVI